MLKNLFGLHVNTLVVDNTGRNADKAAFKLKANYQQLSPPQFFNWRITIMSFHCAVLHLLGAGKLLWLSDFTAVFPLLLPCLEMKCLNSAFCGPSRSPGGQPAAHCQAQLYSAGFKVLQSRSCVKVRSFFLCLKRIHCLLGSSQRMVSSRTSWSTPPPISRYPRG